MKGFLLNEKNYKAELLVRSGSNLTRIAINAGCDLARKCVGTGDYVAEEIQMLLPNSSIITASWTPRKYRNGIPFIASFAEYEDPTTGNFIRFDNAHNRNELHLDSQYGGSKVSHDWNLTLSELKIINRRRVAMIQLMRTLETNVDRVIPICFYMPWCVWWEQYADFPQKLLEKKPDSFFVTDLCEAVMAFVCLNSDNSSEIFSNVGIPKKTIEVIEEAVERVIISFNKVGSFEFERSVLGHTIILPFLMFVPPGSQLEGPDHVIDPILKS